MTAAVAVQEGVSHRPGKERQRRPGRGQTASIPGKSGYRDAWSWWKRTSGWKRPGTVLWFYPPCASRAPLPGVSCNPLDAILCTRDRPHALRAPRLRQCLIVTSKSSSEPPEYPEVPHLIRQSQWPLGCGCPLKALLLKKVTNRRYY